MDLGLGGRTVHAASIEYTLGLRLSGERFVVVESPFAIHSGGQTWSLSPEMYPDDVVQPVQLLVGLTAQEAVSDESGALRVRFDHGTRLDVPPDEAYEAWNMSGPNGALVVCTPGGQLAIWSPREDSALAGDPARPNQ